MLGWNQNRKFVWSSLQLKNGKVLGVHIFRCDSISRFGVWERGSQGGEDIPTERQKDRQQTEGQKD